MEKQKNSFYKAGLAALLLYAGGLIFVCCFHELWFDEAQAWQIARVASYKDMLTVIPHYEGHPPLWHLLLSVFAKNGAPYELTMKALNIVIATSAMALIIFRAPFPRPVRLILPFTYFFFFQYGVYSRPYGLTMLALLLAAIFYKERNARPWMYILALILLCLTSAYGIMLSGGLCIVWTFEILTEMIKNQKLVFFWKDKRFYPLLLILIVGVTLLLSIIPAEDCFYGGADVTFIMAIKSPSSYGTMLMLPVESWSGVLLGVEGAKANPVLLTIELLFGLALWAALIAISAKNKKFFTFFLPYVLICGFMSFKYMSVHHLGISSIFHVFIFWIMAEAEGGLRIPEPMKKLAGSIKTPLVRKIIIAGTGIICAAPVLYSVVASINDIRLNCGTSRYAKIIKENHLENTKIMAAWTYEEDPVDKTNPKYTFKVLEMPSEHAKILSHSTYLTGGPVMVLPYFDSNIIMNFNVECPDETYMHYKRNEDYEPILAKWREQGLPDFILGYCPLDEVYDEETLAGVRYLPIAKFENIRCYKLDTGEGTERMYIREDLLDDYPQFHWVEDPRDNVFK